MQPTRRHAALPKTHTSSTSRGSRQMSMPSAIKSVFTPCHRSSFLKRSTSQEAAFPTPFLGRPVGSSSSQQPPLIRTTRVKAPAAIGQHQSTADFRGPGLQGKQRSRPVHLLNANERKFSSLRYKRTKGIRGPHPNQFEAAGLQEAVVQQRISEPEIEQFFANSSAKGGRNSSFTAPGTVAMEQQVFLRGNGTRNILSAPRM